MDGGRPCGHCAIARVPAAPVTTKELARSQRALGLYRWACACRSTIRGDSACFRWRGEDPRALSPGVVAIGRAAETGDQLLVSSQLFDSRWLEGMACAA